MRAKILAIDDHPEILQLVDRILRADFEVQTLGSATEALAVLRGGDIPDVLITDVSMPDLNGIELLHALRAEGFDMPRLVMSGEGSIKTALEAVELGASDFIEKPFRRERLQMAVKACLQTARLREANARLQSDLGIASELVGKSEVMQTLKSRLVKVAESDSRALILGENGSGKELVAAAIHAGSPRSGQPFVKLNCSAVPENLVESELFGHEKGAFTGAVGARKGRFELADGGTLFLDEVGDMPRAMQVKLLRVLQEGVFERVGGTRSYSVDVRVLAATNRDLQAMVADGSFREDLYYRLAVVEVHVPPLRDRRGDIRLLASSFAERAAGRNRNRNLRLSDDALLRLESHDFPGNVRELQNLVERLGIFAEDDVITKAAVDAAMGSSRSRASSPSTYDPTQSLKENLLRVEKQMIEQALAHHENNKPKTAKALGVERSYFYKKCRQHGFG